MKNIAIILAAGTGKRFGSELPKQFVKLAGKPVIVYTIDAFQHAPCIDEIIVVTNNEYIDYVFSLISENHFTKVSKVINGGKERYDSSWSAIKAINEDECNLIFHDAVRPFVSQRIIQECVSALRGWNAVDVVVDPTDTIVKIKNDIIMAIPDRRFMARGQTPQAFKKSVIEEAYNRFFQDQNRITFDDCGVVLKYIPNEEIYVVTGDEQNFKITHQQDLYLADNFIKDGLLASNAPLEKNIEDQLSDKVVVIFGGSSGIGESLVCQCRDMGANVYSFSRRNGCDITNHDEIVKSLELVKKMKVVLIML